jgi:membrane protease YdiL (CAAX protease family)
MTSSIMPPAMSTTASVVPQLPLSPANSVWNIVKNNISHFENWTYLIPTIGVVACCALLSPTFVLKGIGIGIVEYSFMSLMGHAVIKICNLKNEKPSEYVKMVMRAPVWITVVLPILEEGVFRGCLQPLLTRIILFLVPSAAVPAACTLWLGTPMSVALTISIIATALIFGIAHLSNGGMHRHSVIQSLFATLGGIIDGVAAAKLGLVASMTAHMIINTCTITEVKLYTPPERFN